MYLYSEDKVGFGVTLLPNSLDEFVSWCKTAEACDFNAVGIADSQSLYRETFVCCALALQNTERVKIGPRVINPVTRHPAVSASGAATLEEIAPGRTLLGIGTGDSSVHNAGVKPANLAETKEYVSAVKDLLSKGETTYHGETARLTWGHAEIPVYIAASGPKTLELAGEIADGVIIQTGLSPEVIEDALNCIRRGAERAGRDFSKIDKTWFPWVNVASSKDEAIENILHSLASGAKHLARFTTQGKHIPENMIPLIEQVYQNYKFEQHQIPGNDNGKLVKELGLAEYLADRFAIVGTPQDCVRKIEEAAEAGARHFWMSIHFPDKEKFMREWSEKVMKSIN
jgi:5,10-methylenetetrahydromethanopterin reductase